LGALRNVVRTSASIDLPPGGVLLLYTDGLVERRDEFIDEGLQRLRVAVAAEAPDLVCRNAMHDLVGHIAMTDDVALLAAQRT
jgi:serine phosphatase RsbU (regulator of sigma subunit)